MSFNIETLRNNIKSFSERLSVSDENGLHTPEDVLLFISIYRISLRRSDRYRQKLMTNIIRHREPDQNLKTKVELVARFSTIYNNRILGIEIQNASVYGSKIQLAFDDFDRELARKIRKHDIIVIHQINERNGAFIDSLASMFSLGTYYPSGIKDKIITNNMTSKVKDRFTGSISEKANIMADKFLSNEKPIFSGLITVPHSVAGNIIKLTIEGQGMIRILQQINTEENQRDSLNGLPFDMDEFVKTISSEEEIEVGGENKISILTSTILKTLGTSVYEHIVSQTNASIASRRKIKFIDKSITDINIDYNNFNDLIFVRPISNSMYIIHISPIKAIKLFVNYYVKNTGMNLYFDFNMWDDDFYGNREIITSLYKSIFDDMSDFYPFFTYGMILDIDNDDIVPYYDDQVNNTQNQTLQLIKNSNLRSVFTKSTFNKIFNVRVNEGIVLKYLNSSKEEEGYTEILTEFFLNLVRPSEINLVEPYSGKIDTGEDLFLINQIDSDTTAYIISPGARRRYDEMKKELVNDFSSTISIDFIVSSNYASVRSTEYNPVLTNQMKSVPIVQVVQLFLGALTTIPITQNSQNLNNFDNTAYNISQRIWLSSAIGFKKTTNKQSWVYKRGYKPTIYFGLNYSEGVNNRNKKIVYVSEKDIINSKMFTLPPVNSLIIYQWGTEGIYIGYNKRELKSKPQLSLGGISNFDLSQISNKINDFITENDEIQIGGEGDFDNVPRIALFKLLKSSDGNSSEVLKIYDEFDQITLNNKDNVSIYLGYDFYAMNNDPSTINLNSKSDVKLYAPHIDNNGNYKIDDLGVNVFNPTSSNVKSIWKENDDDFPTNNIAKIGNGSDRAIITGIKDYYDPTLFYPILKAFQHYIEFGFTGISGNGDFNIYKDRKLFQIYHNISFDDYYLDTFILDDDNLPIFNSLSSLTNKMVEWLERYIGNEQKKRLMMIKYARKVSTITPSRLHGDDAPFRTGGQSTAQFHPPSLMDAIEPLKITNISAEKTIKILNGFVRSITHFMNIVSKETVNGGVIYIPHKIKKDGQRLKIGDAISFKKTKNIDDSSFKKFTKNLLLDIQEPETNLDLYNKIYYIWKITYYFGGAGTDPSSSSGYTMRVFLTDSGIHWNSSFEEQDITTRIAELMQLNRLAVKI